MPTIVMTGATSGLGAVAAGRFLKRKDTRLIAGTRGKNVPGAETLPLDLASLKSVREFCALVEKALGPARIDALVLNAGLQFANADQRTIDGYETTFAVNHLAHYLMLRLLMPRLASGASMVLTTSGTHDPAAGTIVPAPRHANAELLAHPERDPERDKRPLVAGGRAYSSSKLCNILTARALANQAEARALGLFVVAYDPGATPGTGLVRRGPLLYRIAWRLPPVLLGLIIPQLSTMADAGSALEELSRGTLRPSEGQIYASLRHGQIVWRQPSQDAQRDDLMAALWIDSAKMVGLA